jgi:hypothetical protein
MPAPITHMLIAEQAKDRLLADGDPEVAKFAADVLDKHPQYMKLGSLGPDLPYFGLKSLFNPHKPIGVDQWSYQLHSKSPNLFPLQMIELVWRESDPRNEQWSDGEKCRFAFICGFLTHVAADQIIHPLVNFIAGRYSHSHEAREEHRTCEIHHDLYVLSQQKFNGRLTAHQFGAEHFHSDCHIDDDQNHGDLSKDEFLYFIQKAFVEAHAVRPRLSTLKRKLFFLHGALWLCRSRRWWLHWFHEWYENAYSNLFAADGKPRTDSSQYTDYISLDTIPDRDLFLTLFRGKHNYQSFCDEAVGLAIVYIRAAYEIYRAPRADDRLRRAFLRVVANADLGFPLQLHILQDAETWLPLLRKRVDEGWATVAARKWLALVDDRQNGESWRAVGDRLADTIPRDAFLASVAGIRDPRGSLRSRGRGTAWHVSRLPNAPSGECVVVQFKTSFEKLQSAVETVTAVLDRDRKWRALAYDIK